MFEGGCSICFNVILFVVGWMGVMLVFNLEVCGLEVDYRGWLKVDFMIFEISVLYIYVVGDVIGFFSFVLIFME